MGGCSDPYSKSEELEIRYMELHRDIKENQRLLNRFHATVDTMLVESEYKEYDQLILWNQWCRFVPNHLYVNSPDAPFFWMHHNPLGQFTGGPYAVRSE